MRKGWVHKRIQLYVHVYSHFWYPSSRLATDHYAFAIIRFDLKSIQVDTKIFFLWPLLCKGLAECVLVWEDRECGQCTQHNRDNYPLCNGKCQQRSGYLHTSHQPPRCGAGGNTVPSRPPCLDLFQLNFTLGNSNIFK